VTYRTKDFGRLVSDCAGFLSEPQLRSHFALYEGYVKKLNEIESALRKAPRDAANYSFGEYSELRRREPVAYNGTVLHELYFGNLGTKGPVEPSPRLRAAEEQTFGSWENAVADLKAMTASAHGWVLVTYDWNFGHVRHNLVGSEHHVGLFPNQSVLIAIDCWEHAYFRDYGEEKARYVDLLLQHLNWKVIQARLEATALEEVTR
jgi:Fe-Mn family superoxide dismutase